MFVVDDQNLFYGGLNITEVESVIDCEKTGTLSPLSPLLVFLLLLLLFVMLLFVMLLFVMLLFVMLLLFIFLLLLFILLKLITIRNVSSIIVLFTILSIIGVGGVIFKLPLKSVGSNKILGDNV